MKLLPFLLLLLPLTVLSQPIRTTPTGLRFVRTPSSRFRNLPSYPHPPRYVLISGLRMSYIDAGYAVRGTFLLLHGEPDWGYLYRRMIPVLVRAGFRVIVPDLIGFGRSDKPVSRSAYTVDSHMTWLKQFVLALDLSGLHLFAQDWGGFLGLTVAAELPGRFERLVAGNTALPVDGAIYENPLFKDWVQLSQTADPFLPSVLLGQALFLRNLTEEEKMGYDAPFPAELYLAAARQFPLLVPRNESSPGVERFRNARQVLSKWTKPVLFQWGLKDFALGLDAYEDLRALIPGANGQPHALYPEAGHFVQDDVGPSVAAAIVQWIEETETGTCER